MDRHDFIKMSEGLPGECLPAVSRSSAGKGVFGAVWAIGSQTGPNTLPVAATGRARVPGIVLFLAFLLYVAPNCNGWACGCVEGQGSE
jgi:hypothetical protein